MNTEIHAIESVHRIEDRLAQNFTESNRPVQERIFADLFAQQEKVCREKAELFGPIVGVKREQFWNSEPKDEPPYIELKTTVWVRVSVP